MKILVLKLGAAHGFQTSVKGVCPRDPSLSKSVDDIWDLAGLNFKFQIKFQITQGWVYKHNHKINIRMIQILPEISNFQISAWTSKKYISSEIQTNFRVIERAFQLARTPHIRRIIT